MTNKGSIVLYKYLESKDDYEIINNLISTYDPVEVKECNVRSDKYNDHDYTEDYSYNPEN